MTSFLNEKFNIEDNEEEVQKMAMELMIKYPNTESKAIVEMAILMIENRKLKKYIEGAEVII